jgi:hypothetical protein
MTTVRRLRIDLGALAIATFGAGAVFALFAGDGRIDEDQARCHAADYLSAAPQQAERRGERWSVTDGRDTAWLDARTGELVEIEFSPR